jgi:hypothetical protein
VRIETDASVENVLRSLFLGVISTLLYAIIANARGQGIDSALTTGMLVFLIGVLFPPFAMAMGGSMPGRAYPHLSLLIYIVWNAGAIPLATLAGAQFYREQLAPMESPARSGSATTGGVVVHAITVEA